MEVTLSSVPAAASEASELSVATNISAPNLESSHFGGLLQDISLLQKYNLPSNYHGKHNRMNDVMSIKLRKKAYDLIAEAASIMESGGLQVLVTVINLQTGVAEVKDQFFSSPAMGVLSQEIIGLNGINSNDKIIRAVQTFRGSKRLFGDEGNDGNSRQRSSDTNSNNGTSRHIFLKEIVSNYHLMYSNKHKIHNNISTDVNVSIAELEDQLVTFYRKGYYLEMCIIIYLTGPQSVRTDKSMPMFGCDVDANQHHLLPVHAPREHRDIMTEWHRKLLNGFSRIKKDAVTQSRNNGRYVATNQPTESPIDSTTI